MASPVYILSSTEVEGAINLPVIKTLFFDAQIDMDEFDVLIFTSKNGVLGLEHLGINWKCKPSIVIGEATAKTVERLGGRVSYVANDSYGDELAFEITQKFRYLRFLYPRAKTIASNLPEILRAKGATVSEAVLYETVCEPDITMQAPEEGAIIIFSSPSTVSCFFEKFGWKESYKCVAIGKTTASAIHFCDNIILSPEQTLKAAVGFAKSLI